jgi:two-component system sensor histidine kinase UhpB
MYPDSLEQLMNIPSAQDLRILILEDNADFASLVEESLQQGGFTLNSLIIDTPDAFIAALAQQAWDVVLSDNRMPNFTGMDALRLLRARDTETPFILMSCMPCPSLTTLLEEGGGQYFLDKCDLFDLPEHVARLLRR